jgi:RNA polymerase-interacting CarD/CdnL/TRCF family regulator
MLTIGRKAIYPSQGPCRIDAVVKRVVNGSPMSFYQLTLLDDRGGALFVPVDKVKEIGVRLLLKKSEVPQLIAALEKTTRQTKVLKERILENLRTVTAGSALDLAEVVKTLTELRNSRPLTPGEARTLERSRRLLVWEISEAMGEEKTVVEEQIDRALTRRKSR